MNNATQLRKAGLNSVNKKNASALFVPLMKPVDKFEYFKPEFQEKNELLKKANGLLKKSGSTKVQHPSRQNPVKQASKKLERKAKQVKGGGGSFEQWQASYERLLHKRHIRNQERRKRTKKFL